MITRNADLILLFIFNLPLFKVSVSLECYICADENLSEDGECQAQFRYDCTNYAKNFEPMEPIFCRTTRQQVNNETYTIMKECISEREHYRKFPPMQYTFDEECDLTEVDGDEIAYCICKKSLCNSKSIIDQFIDFEENHSEIFDTTNDDDLIDKQDERFLQSSKRSSADLFHETMKNIYQTGQNNYYETLKPIESDDRQQFNYNFEANINSAASQTYDSTHASNYILRQNYKPTIFAGNITTNMLPERSGHSEQGFKELILPQQIDEMKHQNIVMSGNYCYSCVEELIDPKDDCMKASIIQCQISRITGRSQMCITKQSRIPNNTIYKLEKRCSTDIEETEIEFDEISTRRIACIITKDKSQIYCLCLENYCNKNSLLEQNEALIKSSDGSYSSSIGTIFNGNRNSFISSAVTDFHDAMNNGIQFASNSSSISNVVSKSDDFRKFSAIEHLEHRRKDDIVNNSAINNFSAIIIIIIFVLSVLSPFISVHY